MFQSRVPLAFYLQNYTTIAVTLGKIAHRVLAGAITICPKYRGVFCPLFVSDNRKQDFAGFIAKQGQPMPNLDNLSCLTYQRTVLRVTSNIPLTSRGNN